jgi:hypothetical protein
MTESQITTTIVPTKLCECGCGRPTRIARQNKPEFGHVLGQPLRFVGGHNGIQKREPFIGPPEPGTRMIPLTKGMYAKVDEADYEELSRYNWNYTPLGYAARTDGHRSVPMHRQIMRAPKGMEVDHANHITLDNRRSNLRVCTHAENAQNRPAPRRSWSTSSRYKGVCKRAKSKTWTATISRDGKQMHIGQFETEEEAARAYDVVARELHGEFAVLNFP